MPVVVVGPLPLGFRWRSTANRVRLLALQRVGVGAGLRRSCCSLPGLLLVVKTVGLLPRAASLGHVLFSGGSPVVP
jgi:hypothetical protein